MITCICLLYELITLSLVRLNVCEMILTSFASQSWLCALNKIGIVTVTNEKFAKLLPEHHCKFTVLYSFTSPLTFFIPEKKP